MRFLTERQKYAVTLRYLAGDGTHASLAAEYQTSRQQIANAVKAYADMPDAVKTREELWLKMQLSKLPRRLPGKGGYIHLPMRETSTTQPDLGINQ